MKAKNCLPPTDIGPNEPSDDASGDITGTEEPVTPPSDVEEDVPDCGDEGDLNVDMGGSVTVNPPASEAQTSEPAPVQESATVQEAAPADPAPAQESATVQEAAPADPAPAQESAPVQEEAPAQEISYDVGGEAITEDDLDW